MPTVCFDLILVGFGNVARRFVRLLDEQRDRLAADYDMDCRVLGIATRRHGAIFVPGGVDVGRALAAVESGGTLRDAAGPDAAAPAGALDLIEVAANSRDTGLHGRAERDLALQPHRMRGTGLQRGVHLPVVVETTVLDIRAGEPAISHVRAALASGADVVTANKGPVAFAYRELADLAQATARSFLFEGAVMDGVPVFNFARETLPAVRVTGFRGIVNSTTHHILTAMEEGREFDAALADMQAQGIAEADASLDVDGWDAAAKTAALINVLMEGRVTPGDIDRTGIGLVGGAEVRAARQRGERLRLVVSARREGGQPRGRVAPTLVGDGDVLARLTGAQNAIIFNTDILGQIAVVQMDSGLTQTAYALLSDLVTVRRRRR